MKRYSLALVLCYFAFAAIADEPPPHHPTSTSIARQRFNQVFVKVILPVTARTPKQPGPAIETWVSEQLKEQGASEYFAVTDWVPVCDGLLADDEVDNHIWDGCLVSKESSRFCPVDGDLPERKDGRVLVLVNGWHPGGGHEAKASIMDEAGMRVVEPVLPNSANGKRKTQPGEKPLAYVAILIGPPPRERDATRRDGEPVPLEK